MKKFFALLLALVMSLSLVACGGGDTANEDTSTDDTATEENGGDTATASDVEIAVVLKTLASEYWGYVKAGCDAAAADLGVTVNVVGPGAESEIEQQVSMIEQQIGAGCDAIIVAPNDAGAASGALASAIGSIPVLSVDTNVGIEGQTSFVGTSNVDAAKEGGLWAAEQAGEGANAVIIYGQEGDNTSNMRREGYQAACDEAGVTVLDALSGQNTTDGATKTMEDLLNAYPDQIDIVLCHNDDTAIGAMNACKSAGVDDMIIVGFDGNASAVDLILAGEMVKATVAQQPYEMGYQAVEAALKAIEGETVEEVIKIHTSEEYLIYMIGFIAGFPYLGGMSKEIATPRLKSPRVKIEGGSVGIAGEQTGISPGASPGGWQLIGRTPLKLYDADREKPVLLEAGQYIKFAAVTEEEYKKIEKEVEDGTYKYVVYDKEV